MKVINEATYASDFLLLQYY